MGIFYAYFLDNFYSNKYRSMPFILTGFYYSYLSSISTLSPTSVCLGPLYSGSAISFISNFY